MRRILTILLCLSLPLWLSAQEMLVDDGGKFPFGNASSPEKDFGRGT